jgi:citrate lyase subunit beta / citryl-CoA lyase
MIDATGAYAYLNRSKLFIPGSRPELFEKALTGAADAISFDLEDAVSATQKDQAREAVAAFLRTRMVGFTKIAIVRVNAISSPLFNADVQALIGPGLDILNIPKLETAQDVLTAIEAIERVESDSDFSVKILANIETPKAFRFAAEIATSSARIVGLQIGLLDLCNSCGIDPTEEAAVEHFRLGVRVAAAEAGIAAYDSAFANIRDIEGFRASAIAARRLGFSGKSCIHPSQVPIANEVFSPSQGEIEYAERVVAAAEKNVAGAFALDGKMIDAPVVGRARAILRLAGAANRKTAPTAT